MATPDSIAGCDVFEELSDGRACRHVTLVSSCSCTADLLYGLTSNLPQPTCGDGDLARVQTARRAAGKTPSGESCVADACTLNHTTF